MDAKEQDIIKLILKEAYNFKVKRAREPEYAILDNAIYEELKAQCMPVLVHTKKEVNKEDRVCGMRIVRTYLAGRGIAVGETARP